MTTQTIGDIFSCLYTSPQPRIWRAGINDMPLLMAAQEASEYEMLPMCPKDVEDGLTTGKIEAYLLSTAQSVMILGVQTDGESAMLCAWHRWGKSPGLGISMLTEAKALLTYIRMILYDRGVTQMYCCISKRNPKYARLIRFYERFGFYEDMTRMECPVGG